MVTGCPNCDTWFRITEDQLRQAGGRVRCGACLELFRAMDNLEPGAERPTAESAQDARHEGSPGVVEQRGLRENASAAAGMSVSEGPEPARNPRAGRRPRRLSPGEKWVYRALAAGVVVLILQVVWYLGYR